MSELYKIWYGLRFFKRMNVSGSYVVASYHHPDSITWRWVIHYNNQERSRWMFPEFGPSYSMGERYFSPNGEFGAWLRLPFIGTFSISTQAHMWRTP